MSGNPKAYYNQPDYAGNRKRPEIHKPDDASADMAPPPYSPPMGSEGDTEGSISNTYGTIISGQPGLLGARHFLAGPSSSASRIADAAMYPPSPASAPAMPVAWNNPHIPREWSERGMPMPSPVSAPQPSPGMPPPGMPPPAWAEQQENNGSGKKWFKYIFLGILAWLVLTKYSGWFNPSDPSKHIGLINCKGAETVYKSVLPKEIQFDKDLSVSLEGHVSGGQLIIHSLPPGDEATSGSIHTRIRLAPPRLQEELSYTLDNDNDETRLVLKMPTHPLTDSCIFVEMEIYLPTTTTSLRTSMPNIVTQVVDQLHDVDIVQLRSTNAPISLDQGWSGKQLVLETRNGNIRVGNGLKSDETVSLKTTNGVIAVTDVTAKSYVALENTNGQIEAYTISANDKVLLRSSNGAIVSNAAVATQVIVETSNGAVSLAHIQAKREALLKTSNAPIEATIENAKDVIIKALTSNGPATIHMPMTFEGHFMIQTSNWSRANVRDQLGEEGHIVFHDNQRHYKQGQRLQGQGDIIVTTSNANANLVFDV
ncbi:uncharacterized protein BYT42DRAFT_259484 [Radiomyces spectabilis]|uniref:uncharacterized protein n=1 Tax=Radiomyces spectabilis TaxID=64574 RepID=UPI0022202897|nr:uncharacterized protein BYT42DRAFT_259484 [Radiomyces spectabilis]KAI8384398.1 hypothetical protein BYT42DRAFT_259484 [Radiomyces spectabilis]